MLMVLGVLACNATGGGGGEVREIRAPTREATEEPAEIAVAPSDTPRPADAVQETAPPPTRTPTAQPVASPTLGILPPVLRETPTPTPTPSPVPEGGIGISAIPLMNSTVLISAVSCQHIRTFGCGIVNEMWNEQDFTFDADQGDDICLAWIEYGHHSDTGIELSIQRGQENPVVGSYIGIGGSTCRYVQVAGVTADSYSADLQYLDQFVKRLTFEVEDD
jgi:hypothetical protein